MFKGLKGALAFGVVAGLTAQLSAVELNSKAYALKLSGKHYLGYVSDFEKEINKFETRRNYLDLKAYMLDNPKNYMRFTLDTYHNKEDGSWNTRLKYAYLYLHNLLPSTSVEIGQAHRPWNDYEDHYGWHYRAISKAFAEAKLGAHYTGSADLGINFKTKTDYFTSEIGLFNGEGYHAKGDSNSKLSFEYRLSAHLLGGGRSHASKKSEYLTLSCFGQLNSGYKEQAGSQKEEDFNWYGIHGVYNQPLFLIAAQYIKSSKAAEGKAGEGYSVNGALRVAPKWELLARYDEFKPEGSKKNSRTIGGVNYQYSKNIAFLANYLEEKKAQKLSTKALMLTAEVKW